MFSTENYDGKPSASDRVCTLSWKEREKTNLTITHSHFHSTLLLSSADSWRARSSFVPELQMHVSSGAVRIDFGGLDRWDQVERQRNMAEASVLA